MVITNEARTKTKAEIIQELQEKNILDCETWKGGGPWGRFNDEEKAEIQTAIFENIKRNSEGWRTQKVRTVNYVYAEKDWCNGWFSFLCPKLGTARHIEDRILLLHETAEIKYDDGFLIWDYSRMSAMTYFTEEQKTEITELLRQRSQPVVASTSQFSSYIEQPLTTSENLRLSYCYND